MDPQMRQEVCCQALQVAVGGRLKQNTAKMGPFRYQR
jgi:hypothetical protein